MSDTDHSELDRLVAGARATVRRWASLSDLEKREHVAATWEAIAGALNDAYLEQRSASVQWRLTQDDVCYARRVAVWMRFELELETWRADEANAAAEAIAKRAKQQTGAAAVLPDELKTRLATKPKAPDTREPPVLPPNPGDKPADWPPMTGLWSTWLEELMSIRRPRAKQHRERDEVEAAE